MNSTSAADQITRAIERGRQDLRKRALYDVSVIGWARYEHAWLLRAEGLKFREIAARLGVSSARAREMVLKFARRFDRAARRCRMSTGTLTISFDGAPTQYRGYLISRTIDGYVIGHRYFHSGTIYPTRAAAEQRLDHVAERGQRPWEPLSN